MILTHGSLFSGIGGFDLAAQWAGFENKFWCEIDPFAQRVLSYHFPESHGYYNIKTTNFGIWRGKIDVLSGGFPCQPFSVAGRRKGADDDRYLWDEMLRAISEIRPTWVVGENVAGILSMVQPSEEARMANEKYKSGESDYSEERQEYVLASIIRDLNNIGYDVQCFVIPACAVGAPHRRDRLWIVAHASDPRVKREQEGTELSSEFESSTDSDNIRSQGDRDNRQGKGKSLGRDREEISPNSTSCGRLQNNESQQAGKLEQDIPDWRKFPTQSPLCRGDDGLSEKLDSITFSQWRRESIKAYGNAIVPQVALEIFRTIKNTENEKRF